MSECWEWRGYVDQDGYGWCKRFGEVLAHRVAYVAFKGEIPAGLEVCHACDNPSCVNPAHLFAGTAADNQRDKVDKQRQARGESHGRRKLCGSQVLDIRARMASGADKHALAAEFGVTYQAINAIVKRKVWKHV